jgi:bleomycin hydrolase
MNRYHLADFELSQAYLFYWDKIEKANFFLEQIVATAGLDLSSRLVQTLLQDPVTDGGQWDMVANVVRKYGLVPHVLYPDPVNAQASAKMDWLVTAKLREHALRLRSLVSKSSREGAMDAAVARAKDEALREIHALVTLMLGPPPRPDEEFVWEFDDAVSGRARRVVDTPRGFAEKAFAMAATRRTEVDPTSMISLVNDPRNEFGRLMTVDRLGNVVEGRPITYVNVDMKVSRVCLHVAWDERANGCRQSKQQPLLCSAPAIRSSSAATWASPQTQRWVSWMRNCGIWSWHSTSLWE